MDRPSGPLRRDDQLLSLCQMSGNILIERAPRPGSVVALRYNLLIVNLLDQFVGPTVENIAAFRPCDFELAGFGVGFQSCNRQCPPFVSFFQAVFGAQNPVFAYPLTSTTSDLMI